MKSRTMTGATFTLILPEDEELCFHSVADGRFNSIGRPGDSGQRIESRSGQLSTTESCFYGHRHRSID